MDGLFIWRKTLTLGSPSQPVKPINRGGRPPGTFGPRKRQLVLVDQYIRALGGSVSPLQERWITRAVLLESIAETRRHEIDCNGGSSADIVALAKLESVADLAVRRLRIPVKAINTGQRRAGAASK